MQVFFLGLPGAGKGTQAVRIKDEFHIPHIATGDMFRAAIAAKSELGEEVKSYLDSGTLVPDTLTIRVVRDRLLQPDAANGFLLDGFPRTIAQAEALDEMLNAENLPLTNVLYLEVSEEELLKRLTGRRVCPKCGASYHVTLNPPHVADTCDRCGEALTHRADDRPEAVSVRLRENLGRTAELTAYYEKRGLLTRIQGEQSVDEVYEAIRNALQRQSG